MSKQKGYVIAKKSWRYNDEYYTKTEGGTPQKILFNKETAERESLQLEVEAFKGEILENYDQDLKESAREFFIKKGWIDEDYEDYLEVPRDASNEDIKELLDVVDIRFFEVIEVEVDE